MPLHGRPTPVLPGQSTPDRGATMVEYGLLTALIAVAAVAGVTLLGTALANIFTAIAGVV